MKRFVTFVAAAAAVAFAASTAVAGPVYLWGTTAKGKTAKAGKYGSYTRIYTETELKRLKAKTRKVYSRKASYCGKDYMISKRQAAFLSAHKRAKHMVVVRERVGKGKFKKLCDA